MCPTANDSRALNEFNGACMIMAGAGMCTGGRVLHHFRYNLAKPATTVIIVGYQGQGSLGRMLVDGKKSVTIFGERIPVRASVQTFGGLSGHAGQTDLLNWFDSIAPGSAARRADAWRRAREKAAGKPHPPLAGAEDFDIPQCVPGTDEAVAVIREHHARWRQENQSQ